METRIKQITLNCKYAPGDRVIDGLGTPCDIYEIITKPRYTVAYSDGTHTEWDEDQLESADPELWDQIALYIGQRAGERPTYLSVAQADKYDRYTRSRCYALLGKREPVKESDKVRVRSLVQYSTWRAK